MKHCESPPSTIILDEKEYLLKYNTIIMFDVSIKTEYSKYEVFGIGSTLEDAIFDLAKAYYDLKHFLET